MRRLLSAIAVVTVLPGPVAGADLGIGMLAFDQGEYAAAMEEWLPLAESGDATAQSLIAMMYRMGEGIGRDDATAAAWYRRAAVRGHPYAQFNLGLMYRDGEGLQRDLVQAYVWFALAAESIPTRSDGTSSASRARDAVAVALDPTRLEAAQEQVSSFAPIAE